MLDAVSTVWIDGMYMLSTLLAPVPCCSVRSYQLLLICCSTSLVLLLHFRPRPDAVSTRSPVITRGPPARFAYLGKLAHRRGAIRRHDSWLASHLVGLLREHILISYSRAVSRRGHWRSVGLRSTAPLSAFDLPPHSSTHFIHYLLQIRKSLWLFFSICSVPCLLWGIEGPKADGTRTVTVTVTVLVPAIALPRGHQRTDICLHLSRCAPLGPPTYTRIILFFFSRTRAG